MSNDNFFYFCNLLLFLICLLFTKTNPLQSGIIILFIFTEWNVYEIMDEKILKKITQSV